MKEKERFELFGEHCIKDNNPDARCQLLNAYQVYVILNEQDKENQQLKQQLAEKDKEIADLQHKLKVAEITTKLACENISFKNPCDYCKYTKEVSCPMDCENNKNFTRDMAIKQFIEEAKEMIENK